jgi:hypothetical protein
MLRMRLAMLAAVACIAAACTSTPAGSYDSACSVDGDCQGGLRCLPVSLPSDGGCVPQGNACVYPCSSTANCGYVGTAYICQTACGGQGFCELPMQ